MGKQKACKQNFNLFILLFTDFSMIPRIKQCHFNVKIELACETFCTCDKVIKIYIKSIVNDSEKL